MNIPNIVSLLRIVFLIPFFIIDIKSGFQPNIYSVAFLVLVCITDWLDGFLARRLNQISELGKIIDPVVDKISFVAMALYLSIFYKFPYWIVIFIFIREISVLFGAFLLSRKTFSIPSANIWYKFATFILAVSLLVFYLKNASLGYYLIYFALFFVIISSLSYLKKYLNNIFSVNYTFYFFSIFVILIYFLVIYELYHFKVDNFIYYIIIGCCLIFQYFLIYRNVIQRKKIFDMNNRLSQSIQDPKQISNPLHTISNKITGILLKIKLYQNYRDSNYINCVNTFKEIFNKASNNPEKYFQTKKEKVDEYLENLRTKEHDRVTKEKETNQYIKDNLDLISDILLELRHYLKETSK